MVTRAVYGEQGEPGPEDGAKYSDWRGQWPEGRIWVCQRLWDIC